jgi:hypothetical protein
VEGLITLRTVAKKDSISPPQQDLVKGYFHKLDISFVERGGDKNLQTISELVSKF